MQSALTNLFFRLYARNLRRSWRGTPATAWADAILSIDALICLPLFLMLVPIAILTLKWFPAIKPLWSPGGQIAIIVAIGLAVDLPLSAKFRSYRREPISRESFNSSHDRKMLVVSGVISVGCCLLFGAAGIIVSMMFCSRGC